MSNKEWLVGLAVKVVCLTVVVILVMVLNYSTWDSVKDIRATLLIVIYYIAQSIVADKVTHKDIKDCEPIGDV